MAFQPAPNARGRLGSSGQGLCRVPQATRLFLVHCTDLHPICQTAVSLRRPILPRTNKTRRSILFNPRYCLFFRVARSHCYASQILESFFSQPTKSPAIECFFRPPLFPRANHLDLLNRSLFVQFTSGSCDQEIFACDCNFSLNFCHQDFRASVLKANRHFFQSQQHISFFLHMQK